MTEHPILFSPEMVRAILDGRKTQTRHVCLQDVPPRPPDTIHAAHLAGPLQDGPYLDAYCDQPKTRENPRGAGPHWCWWTRDNRCGLQFKPALWIPGDTLWVKETWAPFDGDGPRAVFKADADDDGSAPYLISGAGGSGGGVGNYRPEKWRSSRHMPRWASRITLRVTGVRVERLQDISDADAIAEGVTAPAWNARDAYREIWDALNAKRGYAWDGYPWDANPWVAVTTFERISP